jgi:hypothetical protein
MEMEVELMGTDATESSVLSLQDWIKNESITGLQSQRKTAPPAKGELGLELLPVLSIILGSAAVVELVKSIHVWLKYRRPKVKVKFRVGPSEVVIDAENLPQQQEFVEKVLAKMGNIQN